MRSNVLVSLSGIECCKCNAVFGMTDDAKERYKNNHKTFGCPYCFCPQSYQAKSELERANEALEREKKRIDDKNIKIRHLENSLIAEKGHKTRLKKKLIRVENGVCPDCNRSFQNLSRHMKSKHGCGAEI